MASIKFDSTEIINTTYVPRFAKHESVANREVISMSLARDDGEIIISERYGIKNIILQGIVTGTSQANLEANIDTMKELFSRPEKNLDVDWNNGTLRFVATCTVHDFDRDHFHLLFCPWKAEFAVSSGVGKATTSTKVLDENSVTVTTPGSDSFSMIGTKPAKAKITIKGSSFPGGAKGLEYKNVNTGERIVITRNKTWTTDSLIIDCELRKVTDNVASAIYVEGPFYGVFPAFKIGTNNVLITVGGIVNQETSENGDFTYVSNEFSITDAAHMAAQSFSVPYRDDTFQGIKVALRKTGSPGNLTWRIETDNGNEPSGSLAHANATGTIAAASIGGSLAYVASYSGNLWTLDTNTKYWLKITGAGADGSNYCDWGAMPDIPTLYPRYTKGQYLQTVDGGATWETIGGGTIDFMFKILYGGEPSTGTVKHTVEYTKTYL